MKLEDIERFAREHVATDVRNAIWPEEALLPELAGVRLYEEPIFGVAAATDPYFAECRRPEVVGPEFRMPEEWLEGAQSVISFFLPFTEAVRASNRCDGDTSPAWLHGRIEGQKYLEKLSLAIAEELRAAGYRAVVPILEEGFRQIQDPEQGRFLSTWSERHVAWTAGLGTFGLSKGIITRRGMAGRFGSVVTDLELTPTQRPYTGIYDYCNGCGACAVRCPAGAIDPVRGKDKVSCWRMQQEIRKKTLPRFGCGKCQTGVPCEHGFPAAKAEGQA